MAIAGEIGVKIHLADHSPERGQRLCLLEENWGGGYTLMLTLVNKAGTLRFNTGNG